MLACPGHCIACARFPIHQISTTNAAGQGRRTPGSGGRGPDVAGLRRYAWEIRNVSAKGDADLRRCCPSLPVPGWGIFQKKRIFPAGWNKNFPRGELAMQICGVRRPCAYQEGLLVINTMNLFVYF